MLPPVEAGSRVRLRIVTADDMFSVRPLHLELGCGRAKRNADAVGIDLMDDPAVDVVGDALEVLRTLPNASVSSIYSEHFMEHVKDPLEILREAARVLEPGGRFRVVVPHFSNPAYYSDPTHHTHFGLYTFSYWVRTDCFRRGVPEYVGLPMELRSARYNFKSSRPFYVRHAIKKALACWVNLSRWTQEFYEEHLCWIMPCYEVDFLLVRD